jgi:hypothetical protein
MDIAPFVARAFEVFGADASLPPPLTLRGANAVDSYDLPEPYDPVLDPPTDAYLQGFAFWGITHLDAQSWRHYLPHLIDYAFRHPDDPAMVVDALVRSLRPPDRYPPRLGALGREQEEVVRAFLEHVALDEGFPGLQFEAQQALDEWWLPNPRSRPTADDIAAMRATPAPFREVRRDAYRLLVPETLTGSGVTHIPQESRRVETFGGYLRGDAHTVVAINVTPLAHESLGDAVGRRAALFRGDASQRSSVVRGSVRAERLDGLTQLGSPAEPQTLTMVLAVAGDELVTLSVRSWPREDVQVDVERLVDSLEIRDMSRLE